VGLVRSRWARGAPVYGGLHIDFGWVRGRQVELALGGWILSLGLGLFLATILWVLGIVQAPMIIALVLSTTVLGTIIPSLQDSGSLNTRLGEPTYLLQVRSASLDPSSLHLCS